MRLLGLDPGLGTTGWGIIDFDRGRLAHVAHGAVTTDGARTLAERLVQLADGLEAVLVAYRPQEAAVEETFVNRNPLSTLKLGQARGIALLVPARAGLPVAEYPPNLVKKTVVGTGHAAKEQVQMMVRMLLPGILPEGVRSGQAGGFGADAADALAVAICHAHHRQTAARIATAAVVALP